MKYNAQLGDLNSKLIPSKNIWILLPAITTVDKVAAALSLMLSLEKQGKQATVVTEDTLKVSHTNLFGVGSVKNLLPSGGGDNFVLTLSGVVDQNGLIPSLEKLDWYPENGNLNLVFHVVPGQKFAPTNIASSNQGSNVDLVFVLGTSTLTDLGNVYSQNSAQIHKFPIINIDNGASNTSFGQYNVVDPNASSISEMILNIFPSLGLSPDSDIASNLMAGIYDGTANLTQKVTPDTFMALASIMNAGGKVIQTVNPQGTQAGFDLTQMMQNQPAPQPQAQPFFNQPTVTEQPADNFTTPQVINTTQTSASKEEVPSGEFATTRGPEGTEFITGGATQSSPENVTPAPDWLTPKIFKGGGLG